MELKPQDLLVLLKVAAHPPQRWTYAALGAALSMSASETHASVKRSVASGLAVAPARGQWSPVRANLLEFVVYGVRYVWPATLGPVKSGVPIAVGSDPLASQLTAAPGEAPVWAYPTGSSKGPTLSPLYRTTPQAALSDPALHRLLALLNALRTGRARERELVTKLGAFASRGGGDFMNSHDLEDVLNIIDGRGELGAELAVATDQSKKPRFRGAKCLNLLVAWGGIEPPTQGFSILCSTD